MRRMIRSLPRLVLVAVLTTAVLGVLSPTPAIAATSMWDVFEPRVVDHDDPQPLTYTASVAGSPTRVQLTMPSGTLTLASVGNGLYRAQLTPEQLLWGYEVGDGHNFVGYLDVYTNANRDRANVFVNVKDQTVPNVAIKSLGEDLQVSPHLVNLRWDELYTGGISKAAVQAFYSRFSDEFDFVAVMTQVDHFENRHYEEVRQDTEGIGAPFYDYTAEWGSAGRLQGAIHYPISDYFDLGESTASHEIGHRWMVDLNNRTLRTNCYHWPLSDVAIGIMGYTSGGCQGLDFPYELIPLGNGDYRLNFVGPSNEFNDLELYLMGLLPPEEVGDHFVFKDQNQVTDDEAILKGPVEWVTIQDIVASDGIRRPAFSESQKDFRIATIVLSKDRLLTPDEMAFFDHMAARGEAREPLHYTSGFSEGTSYPWYLATGARSTLSSSICPVIVDGGATDICTRDEDEPDPWPLPIPLPTVLPTP